MTLAFTGEITPRDAIQLGVDDRCQALQYRSIAVSPGLEHAGQFDRRRLHLDFIAFYISIGVRLPFSTPSRFRRRHAKFTHDALAAFPASFAWGPAHPRGRAARH